jgi:hypothetical protein
LNLAYLTVIASTHIAFAGVFGFMFWEKRRRFALTLSIAWIMQAARIVPLLQQASGGAVSTDIWAAADLLLPGAICCLLIGGADLTGRVLPPRWGWTYVLSAGAFILAGHYGAIPLLTRISGVVTERQLFWVIFLRQIGTFVPAGFLLLWLASVFYRHWRAAHLPGAGIAAVFAVPYALGVLLAPLQWYWSFYPPWAHFSWFLQILGLSTGLLMLVLNQEHADLQATLDRLRRLQGLIPICASCKRIRDDAGSWREIEIYVHDHSEAEFSHGICPRCAAALYPELRLESDEQA